MLLAMLPMGCAMAHYPIQHRGDVDICGLHLPTALSSPLLLLRLRHPESCSGFMQPWRRLCEPPLVTPFVLGGGGMQAAQ